MEEVVAELKSMNRKLDQLIHLMNNQNSPQYPVEHVGMGALPGTALDNQFGPGAKLDPEQMKKDIEEKIYQAKNKFSRITK